MGMQPLSLEVPAQSTVTADFAGERVWPHSVHHGPISIDSTLPGDYSNIYTVHAFCSNTVSSVSKQWHVQRLTTTCSIIKEDGCYESHEAGRVTEFVVTLTRLSPLMPGEVCHEHVDFSGKWKLTESHNFDEYMKVLGVGYLKRKLAHRIYPAQDWERLPDGTWQMTTHTPLGDKVETFPIGDTIEDVVDGNHLSKTSSWRDGVLVTTVTSPSYPSEGEMRRYIDGDRLILQMLVGGVCCTRVFERQ